MRIDRLDADGESLAEAGFAGSVRSLTAASADAAFFAANALGPEAGGLFDLDPALFGRALAGAAAGAARHPMAAAGAGVNCAVALTRATFATALRSLGCSAPGPATPDDSDHRFADPAWEENPIFFWVLQSYLLLRRLAEDLVAAGDLDEDTRAKAAFGVSLLSDALAPTNALMTNPAALKRAFDTGGRSVLAATTADARGRSTRARSESARTWRPRRARSYSATT